MNKDQIQGWLAGLLDGEGCILVREVYTTIGENALDVRVSIANTNLELLETIKSIVGYGSIHKGYITAKSTKPAYRWNCPVGRVKEFLDIVEPLLIVKREKAALARRLLDTVKHLKPESFGYAANMKLRKELLEAWKNDRSRSKQITAGAVGNA